MSVQDAHSEFNSLVTRYLSGELSAAEIERIEKLVAADPVLADLLEEYRKIWASVDSMAGERSYDLDAEWSLLADKIPGMGTGPDAGVDTGGQRGAGRTLLWYTYRIAAVLVVGLIFAFAWIYTTQLAGTELLVAGNEPMEVKLEDGSHIVLNRNSQIRYRKEFKEGERKIRLEGEAWFDVARDTSRPFVIDAGIAMVEVLGTSFNVNAYRENPTVEITVQSGVVAVTAKQDRQEQIVLRAGNSGTYDNKKRELVLVPESDPNNISWKTRELYFENTPFREVARVVSKVYNVQVVIGDEEIESCPITVTFSDQSLKSVMNVLESTLDLEITRNGDRILVDGEGCVE